MITLYFIHLFIQSSLISDLFWSFFSRTVNTKGRKDHEWVCSTRHMLFHVLCYVRLYLLSIHPSTHSFIFNQLCILIKAVVIQISISLGTMRNTPWMGHQTEHNQSRIYLQRQHSGVVITRMGAFLCGVCMFLPCLCGFSSTVLGHADYVNWL